MTSYGGRLCSEFPACVWLRVAAGSPWLTDGTVTAHINGTWVGLNAGLQLQAISNTNGSDGIGSYSGVSVAWALSAGVAGNVVLNTAFLCYLDAPLVAFRTQWPLVRSTPGAGWSASGYVSQEPPLSSLLDLHVVGLGTRRGTRRCDSMPKALQSRRQCPGSQPLGIGILGW